MAKGRDTWDYLAYYLQLFDSAPPLSELQLFRTPLTPLVLGIPLDLGRPGAPRRRLRDVVRGRDRRLERGRADLRTSSRSLQRRPAARLPRVRDDLSPGLERRRLRDRARGLGAARRACAGPADGLAVRGSGRRHRRARAHSACEPGPAPGSLSCHSSRPSPGGAASHGRERASRLLLFRSPPGRCTTASGTTTRPWRVADARGCRSSSCSRGTRRSRPTTGRRRVASPT